MFEGVVDLQDKLPTLLVLNKKDLIKPGEIAKKIEVYICIWSSIICCIVNLMIVF